MTTLDLLVRTCSVLIAVIILHQFCWSKGGNKRHVVVGYTAVAVGTMLLAVVILRGAQQPASGMLYNLHLIIGTAFFVLLFWTVVYGRTAYQVKDGSSTTTHKRLAKATALTLVLSLVAGITSAIISH